MKTKKWEVTKWTGATPHKVGFVDLVKAPAKDVSGLVNACIAAGLLTYTELDLVEVEGDGQSADVYVDGSHVLFLEKVS